jgi:SAM-dependent methyltransferase
LVVPSFEKNRGGGHLVRSASLVRSLRAEGRETFLFLSGDEREGNRKILKAADLSDESWILREDPRRGVPGQKWDFIILDRFKTPPEEADSWASLAPLIGIDEGGPGRDYFDVLIDLLPGLPGVSPPNRASPSLIPLPKNRRASFYMPREASVTRDPFRILISFGAEDPRFLTVPTALGLANRADPEILEITVIAPLLPEEGAAALRAVGVRVLKGMPELREHLAEYDLVITHFGLTAFEALHARIPVFLVSPGGFHEKLARHGGFFSAGIGPAAARRTGKLLLSFRKGRPPILNTGRLYSLSVRCGSLASRYDLDAEPDRTLGKLLAGVTPRGSRVCPVCAADSAGKGLPRQQKTLARFPDRTYRRCGRCGMVYMFRSSLPAIEYETDYFFGFYKDQYGKTYLEDFPNLIAAGKKRLSSIGKLLPPGENSMGQAPPAPGACRLLDIGCAYGPFLAAARDAGFDPVGVDPAPDAIRYIREELGIAAHTGSFPEKIPPEIMREGGFTVISLWYVIEHFEELRGVLQKINRLLKPGGVLAFSTPSFSGISGRISPGAFLEKSPPDHWTVWSPGMGKKVLARYGFELKRVVVTGHHPERFPLGSRIRRGGFLWAFFSEISRLFRLGDTFECYAIKRKDI